MLQLNIPETELFNEETSEFFTSKAVTFQIEHSLVSISKWESKWKIPFFSKKHPKTQEQTRDYIRCMTVTQNVDPELYLYLSDDILKTIDDYIKDSMTATWFGVTKEPLNKDIITSELIYYQMFVNNIPMECQKWHINRLLTLIRVCQLKNAPEKKMNRAERKEMLAQRAALNAQRRSQINSKG